MIRLLIAAALLVQDGTPQFGNGNENAGGGGNAKKKPEEKVNPKAVNDTVIVRWYSPDVKSADVEAALKGKEFVKGITLRAEEQIVVVNWFGEPKDVDQVRKLIAKGEAVTLSPCKLDLAFKPKKDAKPDPVKMQEKVRVLRGISKENSFSPSAGSWLCDVTQFNSKSVGQAAAAFGYDVSCTSHDVWTLKWEYAQEGQVADPVYKGIMGLRGVMVGFEFDAVARRMVVMAEKGTLSEGAAKGIVEKAGLKFVEFKK